MMVPKPLRHPDKKNKSNKKPVLAFLCTPRNQNSMAAIVGALVRENLDVYFQIRLIEHPDRLSRAPLVLAYSFTTPEFMDIQAELSKRKRSEKRPTWLIAGGPHPSTDPQGTLQAGFDVVFVGEGEQTFPAFIRKLLDHRANQKEIYRAEPNDIDLNQFLHVVPKYRLFPFAEISRGCPHRCGFCQVPILFGRKSRFRNPEVVAEGIEEAVWEGYHRFRYLTSNAFAYRPKGYRTVSLALADLLKSTRQRGASQQMLGSFPSEVRPEHVSPSLLGLVRDWCLNRTVVIGAQSGSDRVLSLMARGHTVQQSKQAIRKIAQAGLRPHVDVLFCFPGEQPEERHQTLDLIRFCIERCHAKIHAHVYLPTPGVPAWPNPPEKLEQDIKDTLWRFQMENQLDGDWAAQIELGRHILGWREKGMILV